MQSLCVAALQLSRTLERKKGQKYTKSSAFSELITAYFAPRKLISYNKCYIQNDFQLNCQLDHFVSKN